MAEIPMPDYFVRWMRDVERRLAAQERSPQMGNAAMSDPAGTKRVQIGLLDDDSYGLQVFDENGDTAFKASGVGLTDPGINLPYRQGATPMGPITSGSFTLTWETSLGVITHDAIRWGSLIQTDAATTAEAYLTIPQLGVTSVTKSVAASNNSNVTAWKWKPPLPIGKYAPGGYLVQMYVRRATGAGNVYAYAPDALYMANSADIGATATGA
jgi:hypothetical protein